MGTVDSSPGEAGGESGGGCRIGACLPLALTAVAPIFCFHRCSAKGKVLQRNNQSIAGWCHPLQRQADLSLNYLRSAPIFKNWSFVLPSSPGPRPPPCQVPGNSEQSSQEAHCIAWQWVEARERRRAVGLEGRVATCPNLPRAFLALALKILHLTKLLSLRQTGTRAQPTNDWKENCRPCLRTDVLSHSTLLATENPDSGKPVPWCPCSNTAGNQHLWWWGLPTLCPTPGVWVLIEYQIKHSIPPTEPLLKTPSFYHFTYPILRGKQLAMINQLPSWPLILTRPASCKWLNTYTTTPSLEIL